jgi:transposase
MLSLGGETRRVYLAVGATDLRKGFDGLYGLVRSRLEEDPMSGQLFVFCNATRTRVKALFFDGSGLWLCAKRLGRGRFDWPEGVDGVAKVAISRDRVRSTDGRVELTRHAGEAVVATKSGASCGKLLALAPISQHQFREPP